MRRVAISFAGGSLLLVGVALLVLPGPGIPVILASLALLATEFAWARRWRDAAHVRARAVLTRIRDPRRPSGG